MKNIIQALKIVALALILSFGISYVYAWTAPTVTPPEGNVSAPINTSATAQYKEGALGIGGLLRGYANAIFDGNVGIGTTAPGAKLEVVGDVISKGTSWTIRTSAADNNWYSVTYGNGLFVAVAYSGTGNRVMTSPDGINWTIRTSAADNNWMSVTYGNGLFVAVSNTGTGNRVMTSPDGINWTIRSSAANNNWTSVTYGNGLFVAVSTSGTGNRVMTSHDGINWTIRTSAADNFWYSVTYGNGLFVAVAYSGTGNRVMTSPDGITWTSRTSAANNGWLAVTYGNGLFVAVAYTGNGNRVMTSPDGINWTLRTSAANNNWYSVTYGDGLFVAVAYSGTGNRVMTSPDGITWTSRTSAADNNWNSVTYGNGLFVTVSNSGTGNRVMTSGKQGDQVVSHDNTYQGGMNIRGNVGIGTTAPTQSLDVVGNIKGTGLCIGADCKTAWPVAGVNPPTGSSFLDTSATAQTKAGNITANIITSGGSGGVGEGDFISKASTIYNGTIGGKISFFNTDNVTNTAAIAEIRTVNVSNNTPPTIQSHNSGGKLSFATKGAFSTLGERMVIGADGKVGIGVPAPAQLLDVGGIIKATGLQVTTGAAVGKVLTSDANGNAAWQDAAGGAWECTNAIFCNSTHGSYSFPATVTDWTVPSGVSYINIEMAGGNGSSNVGGTGSFLKYNGTIVMVSGGGGGSGWWDGAGPNYAGGGGVNGNPGAAGGGFNGAAAGIMGNGGVGGTTACGAPAPGLGKPGGTDGTYGAASVYWSYGGYGGKGGGATLEDYTGGTAWQFGGGGGGGYGGGGGGSGAWCGYSYSGGGGGGGGYRSTSLVADIINDKYTLLVSTGGVVRAAAGVTAGYVTISW